MEEIKHLLTLIQKEKEEDLKQYRVNIIETPLNERKKKGITWYPVEIQSTEISTGENFYLTLERTSQQGQPHHFQVGGVVTLFSNKGDSNKKESISGVITSVWKDSMKVSFQIDELPDWTEDGSLGVDSLFDDNTYKEMEAALQKVMAAKEDRLSELRDILLGKVKARFHEEKEQFSHVPEHLNEAQQEAVKNTLLAQDVSIIHGPPGTGKTTTIVQAIKGTLQREKQVLVTAPSNTAVDLLTEKLVNEGINVLRVGHPARVSETLQAYSLDARIASHPDFKRLKKLRKDADEFRNMAFRYKRKFGRDEREQRRLLLAEVKKMKKEALHIEDYIVDSLVSNAQVITATLVGTMNKFIKHRRFSTVFIDEAAQALAPATWIPITKSERVVFAGDHHQLPPTVKSYEAAKAGLEETLFEQCISQQEVDVMLNIQYRMHENIMGFSNQTFYKNELTAAAAVKTHLLLDKQEDHLVGNAVTFIDTAGCGFEEEREGDSLSRVNKGEGDMLIKHLHALLAHVESVDANKAFSVGIISPYKAQVNYLKDQVQADSTLTKKTQLQVNSIDGFQGQERDVIYISLVRSNEEGKIGFLQDTRRMNVALTRARKKLVVIGDSATLSNHSFYQEFLDYIEQINAYQSAWEWM